MRRRTAARGLMAALDQRRTWDLVMLGDECIRSGREDVFADIYHQSQGMTLAEREAAQRLVDQIRVDCADIIVALDDN